MLAVSAAVLAAVAGLADAHGYLTFPRARNLNIYDRDGLSSGGQYSVNANGQYKHGICGNAVGQPQNWAQAGNVTAAFIAGQTIDVEFAITAHHLGYLEFDLCDLPDITEECFAKNKLRRTGCTDSDMECKRFWKPAITWEAARYPSGYVYKGPAAIPGDYRDGFLFKTKFDLPVGVTCSHCVLRWHYFTTNSCDGSSGAVSEEFWNCADIKIVSCDGTARNTDPAPGLNTILLNRQPVDLKPLGLANICPRNFWGSAYLPTDKWTYSTCPGDCPPAVQDPPLPITPPTVDYSPCGITPPPVPTTTTAVTQAPVPTTTTTTTTTFTVVPPPPTTTTTTTRVPTTTTTSIRPATTNTTTTVRPTTTTTTAGVVTSGAKKCYSTVGSQYDDFCNTGNNCQLYSFCKAL